MPFKLDDGYTLRGETTGKGNTESEVLPVLSFEYRPPLAKEASEFRFSMQNARSGDEQHELRCKFLLARIVSWDVVDKDEKPVRCTRPVLDKLPDPIIIDLVGECLKWKARTDKPEKEEEAAKGN